MGKMTDNLIDARTLHGNLARIRLFDIRWKLNDPAHGHESYLGGHVPGAVFVDLDDDLSAAEGPGRHPLPDPATFAATLGRLGLTPDDDVVVYDDSAGTVAARMWWMLRSIGHDRVRLLDGGFDAWLDEDFPVETEPFTPVATTYPVPDGFSGVVDIEDLDGRTLVDVRAPERYEGRTEPIDRIPGHIPGAINIPSSEALEAGWFRQRSELDRIYGALQSPVISCGSGVVACHTALAIAESGRPIPEVYIGSYSEWSSSGRPVATGSKP
jgi:thiosulfate/3-mercaptopyruvate sulfurtransferase